MKEIIKSSLKTMFSPLLKNHVYTMKGGIAKGLKRKGGFGFLPFSKSRRLTPDHKYLNSLNFEGKTIYDVGGELGIITMFFAQRVGETGKVVTFEPNPQNYSSIINHINLNGFSNVNVIKIGLGSKKELVKFVVPKQSSSRGTASSEKQKQYLGDSEIQVYEIEIDTMDNQILVNNLPKPDFVKIDVEGLEIEVLSGMLQTIQNHKPEIFVELHGVKEQEVVDFLLKHNYKVHQVEDVIDITEQNIEKVRGHLYVTP